jgi:hypothetical protein
MEPLKVLIALAWGVMLGAAGLSLADMLFPQSVSVSPTVSAPAESAPQALPEPLREREQTELK